MRLTTLTDYALRLLMHVGSRPERLCTIAEVAEANRISEAHLTKITHLLGLHGWIETVRGKGGGMRLARPASEIPLGEVVRSMESDFRLVECFGEGRPCVLAGGCRLAGIVNGALEAFHAHLDGYSLADILPSPPGKAKVVRLRRTASEAR
jgi:Rrf2 family nitric oxide-sensitive transcriptional repressor